jgi:pimeloyl-ACP methyl ester carboxylesterase
MNRYWLIFLFSLVLACGASHKTIEVSPPIHSLSSDALVVAGLNTNSRVYLPLQRLLAEHKLESSVLFFGDDLGGLPGSEVADWRAHFSGILSRVPEGAVLLGYSQGALLVLDYLVSDKYRGETVVLLAPPLVLRWYADLLRLLLPFKCFGMVVPSLAKPEYRVSWGVPLGTYSTLLKLQELVREKVLREGPFDSSGLVILHKEDELVDSERVLEMFRLFFPRWRVLMIEELGPGPHSHLLVHPDAVGTNSWMKIKKELLDFLETRQAALGGAS